MLQTFRCVLLVVLFGSAPVGIAEEERKNTTLDFSTCCVLDPNTKSLVFVTKKMEVYTKAKDGTSYPMMISYSDKGFDAKLAVLQIKITMELNGWSVKPIGDYGLIIHGHKKKGQELSPVTRVGVFADGFPAAAQPNLVLGKGVQRAVFKDGKWTD